MHFTQARLAQLAERKALNLVVVGSSPTVGVFFGLINIARIQISSHIICKYWLVCTPLLANCSATACEILHQATELP